MASPNPQESDLQLVRRVQKGDRRAFDLLVLKYQYKVQAVVGRYIKDTTEVLDVSQEAFVKAYRAIGNFRGESQFYTWLFRIAVNTAKNHLVSRSRRPPSEDIDYQDAEDYGVSDMLRESDNPEGEFFRGELEKIVNQTMQEMPEDLRVAISLRELEGLSYEDIAEIMDCPVGTVRSRIFRARETINAKINPLMNQD